MLRRALILSACHGLVWAQPVSAGVSGLAPTTTPPVASAPAPASQSSLAGRRIAAGTAVEFAFVDRVNSKLSHTGDIFAIKLTAPIIVDGVEVVPAGATGKGEVVHAARARAMGKAGELILAARFIDHGPIHVPLRGFRYGRIGEDRNRDAMIVALVISPLLPVLMAGGDLDVVPGTMGSAKVKEDVVLPPAKDDAAAPASPPPTQSTTSPGTPGS